MSVKSFGHKGACIKVIGVGGAGGNAVEHMIKKGIDNVEFYTANTDTQALQSSKAKVIQLGKELTKGLGSGADPSVGAQAAQEAKEDICAALEGADMVFITAGMGGGTGTGAAPVIAEFAKEMGILTVAVVTKPFRFEGFKRQELADGGLEKLVNFTDSLILVPNDKLISVLGKSASLLGAFEKANGILEGAIRGTTDLITRPGLINVDFADVRTVMSEMGVSMMGSGTGSGEGRAREAAVAALKSPLLEYVDLSGAKGVLVNVTAGCDLSIGEFEIVGQTIRDITSDQAHVVIGTVIDDSAHESLTVTVIATGLEQGHQEEPAPQKQAEPLVNRARSSFSTQQVTKPVESEKKEAKKESGDLMDIPAFLRRRDTEEAF